MCTTGPKTKINIAAGFNYYNFAMFGWFYRSFVQLWVSAICCYHCKCSYALVHGGVLLSCNSVRHLNTCAHTPFANYKTFKRRRRKNMYDYQRWPPHNKMWIKMCFSIARPLAGHRLHSFMWKYILRGHNATHVLPLVLLLCSQQILQTSFEHRISSIFGTIHRWRMNQLRMRLHQHQLWLSGKLECIELCRSWQFSKKNIYWFLFCRPPIAERHLFLFSTNRMSAIRECVVAVCWAGAICSK